MLGLYKSHQNPQLGYQKKDFSLEKYDSDSEEEDQRREQAEIKQIINKAKIKSSPASKMRSARTLDKNAAIKAKFEALNNQQTDISEQRVDSKGFFTATKMYADPALIGGKRDFAEEMRKLTQPKPKVETKNNQVPRDTRGLLLDGVDMATIGLNKSGHRALVNKIVSPKKKLPEVYKNPKDMEFQKESFNNLLSFYSKSSTKYPMRTMANRSKHPSKNVSPARVGIDYSKEPIDASLQISFIGKGEISEGNEREGIEIKDFQELIPELISAALLGASEPLDKKNPDEVPRFKSINWAEIIKKVGSNKFELLIIDPINFTVEDCLEINSEDPQKVKDIMNDAIKEVTPGMNEAKHILIYYYEKHTNQKKLLFSKFLFFMKNHRYYLKGIKSEKEVATHYLIILALLEFRANYETNPFKDDKVENSKKRGFNIFKNAEPFTPFALEWLASKIQPAISVEKVYINLNVGGKADSNFTFNMHEHLCYAYPKFAQFLINSKIKPNVSLKSINAIEKVTGSDLISYRETGDIKETSQLLRSVDSSKEFKFSPRLADKSRQNSSNLLTRRKNETAQCSREMKNKTNRLNLGNNALNLDQYPIKTAMNSPISTNKFNNQGNLQGYGNAEGQDMFGAMGIRSMSLTGQGFFAQSPRANKLDNSKVYLSTQRMNTSYGQLLKQRFGRQGV